MARKGSCLHVGKPAVDGRNRPGYSSGMGKWTVGDVLLWPEPDWFVKGKRKKEYFKKGERVAVAQIRAIENGYLKLEVLRCEVAYDRSAKGVKILKVGEVITRKATTLKARGATRIAWGGKEEGESARSLVISKFRGPA